MLDVAAVAERLLNGFPLLTERRPALALLVALHDLGKISRSFRAMIRDGGRQEHGRHWEVTELWLRRHDERLADRLPDRWQRRVLLYASVAGHHGRPPRRDLNDDGERRRMERAAGLDAREDAGACIDLFLGLWPEASLKDLSKTETLALSWWLPGLISAADWIGSNTRWFEPRAPGPLPRDYLEQARERAAVAVHEAGLAGATPSPGRLFDFAPRPMQTAAAAVALRDGPMLAVLEDETGSGKTEAALMLAQRMLLAGKGRGLFFALPTTATADAMFDRLCDAVGRMFGAAPTVALAHGRSALSERFRALAAGGAGRSDDVTATPWLADDRRRSLLADVGVGTVDQALLSVLPTRFATLRHYALSSKILIVDEVHEMGEPYLAEEVARLLQAHAMAGGSAILMTATLPLRLRAALVAAFEQGAGRGARDDGDDAYPALTVAGGAARRDLPQATGPRGLVAVRRLPAAGDAVRLLAESARAGAACAWVRNAVDDAIAAVRALRAEGVEADLLHARFALCDRKRHEAAALSRFGKEGGGREGRVLVATQVIESSLDLDFDVMVSDLAPMAALIQRTGRLWRHMDRRAATSRPVSEPTLHVVSPDPHEVADADWLRDALDRGAWTYGVAEQWRTARTLFEAGRIVAPSGLRALIEPVHGEDPIPVPDALLEAEFEALGGAMGSRAHAAQNLVDLARGYRDAGGGGDDAEYPTRLGREERTLVLAHREVAGLRPWAGERDDPEGWMLSEVRAAASKLRGLELPDPSAPEIMAVTAGWPEWRRTTTWLCPVGEGGVIGEGLRYDAQLGLLFEGEPGI